MGEDSDYGDFKKILQNEILSKRKILEEKSGPRKYIKRSELDVTPSQDTLPQPTVEVDEEEPVTNPSPTLDNSTPSSPPKESSISKKIIEEDPLLLISAIDTEPINLKLLSTDSGKVRTLIALFLRRLLREQAIALSKESETHLKSKEGQLSLTVHKQCKDHLKILFKLLKRNSVPEDVLRGLTEIIMNMQNREYMKANNAYLKLAIGNAPWPIGVTAVGIHERSAQEKIKTSSVAHVLNDETTRKWIQAVKRMITFCQSQYPPNLRSQMMG